MKKTNYFTAFLALAACAVIAVLLFIDGSSDRSDSDAIKVAATIFPLYDIARNIAGDKVEVVQILPSGASPHTYEVTPGKIKELQNTKIIFAIGEGTDDWTENITESITGAEIKTVSNTITLKKFSDLHSHDHEQGDEEGSHDPHYWLSPTNAKIIAATIAEALSELDPANKTYYEEQRTEYQAALDTLLQTASHKLSQLDNTHMVYTHDAWQYFNDEFGLETVGTFQASPGKEPTPKELAELVEIVEEYNVQALFSEPQLSDDVIRPFAEDTGLPVYVLDPLGGTDDRQSYVGLIQYNVATIFEALK